ncbi:MAG TPA: tetratricopeptide repeat protein [Longimicrobiales bacterium]|nr:tetratricopeptide repeat protein [Longimicrobiales bacterium]
MRRPGLGGLGIAAVALAVWGLFPVALVAQGVDAQEESRRLREASALEWRGQVGEAEAVLVKLLQDHPTSSGGLFALERILRNQARIRDVLPWADRFLLADPGASGVRYMKLRVLVEVDSLDALETEARAWFGAEPQSPDPYREVARLYQRALGDGEALDLLLMGRRALGESGALALEIGDLRARTGDPEAAVAEWSQALRDPQADLPGILRRLERLDGDPAVLAPPLLEALAMPPTTPERRAAAVRVALQLGLGDEAVRLAQAGMVPLTRPERRDFLEEVARRADEVAQPGVAVWALQEARTLSPERDRSALDVRIAALALQAHDTATAVAAQTRLTRALPVGSVERRRVMADLIRVEAPTASRETLTSRLESFRTEYPDAPELDGLHATVAAGLAARGEVEAARGALGAAAGPLSALEGAYLHFQLGEVEAGRAALDAALPALAPSRATEVLHLLSFLQRVGPAAGLRIAEAAAHAHHGSPDAGVGLLVEALPSVPDADRASLMAWAGEMAAGAGNLDRAEELYAALVEGYPHAPEYPEVALALARVQLERGEAAAARAVLERLILGRPDSPVVPAARRELQRIRSGDRPAAERAP